MLRALSISISNSKTLRKLSSCLPSYQKTEPCQLAFWRNKIRSAKVAIFPSRTVSAVTDEITRSSDVRNVLRLEKDCGPFISSSMDSNDNSRFMVPWNAVPVSEDAWYNRPIGTLFSYRSMQMIVLRNRLSYC